MNIENGFNMSDNESELKSLDDILYGLSDPCEIIADVVFHGANKHFFVAILDKLDLKHLQCTSLSCKAVLQKDLIKKGISEVPIYEYGSNTQERLEKCSKFQLHGEDLKTARKILRDLKKEED